MPISPLLLARRRRRRAAVPAGRSDMRSMAAVRVAGLLVATAFLLTSCMKMDVSLRVNANETVSGTALFAFDRRVASLLGDTEETLLRQLTETLEAGLPQEARTES